MLTAEGFSETGQFMHFSSHIFRSQKFQECSSYEAHFFFFFFFFWKCCKFNTDSKNPIKQQQNVFGFPDNYIWNGSGNLSLLGHKYTWLGVNVLRIQFFESLKKFQFYLFTATSTKNYSKWPIKAPRRLFENKNFWVGVCLDWVLNRTRIYTKKNKNNKKCQT